MTKRKMFLRMVTASLLRRRSRMIIALLSIAIGACILSGLVTIYIDVPRQMGKQFESYGANMLLLSDGTTPLTKESAEKALEVIPEEDLVGATPYRYVTVDMVSRQQSFTAAGTDFDQVQKTSPYFSVEGEYPSNEREVMIGAETADTIGAKVGSYVELTYTNQAAAETAKTETTEDELVPGAVLVGTAEGYNTGSTVTTTVTIGDDGTIASLVVDASNETDGIGQLTMEEDFTSQFIGKKIPITLGTDVDSVSGATFSSTAVVDAINTSHASTQAASKTMNFKVTGILSTGGDEEAYIFMSTSDMGLLTSDDSTLDAVEMRVNGSSDELDSYVQAIDESGTGTKARLVKRVAKSEASVLTKLQSLVLLVTIVVLVLTMVSVSTTMTAVVSERRKEIGLRKALGASDKSIRQEFLGEGMLLGLLGGLLGGILGFGFAQFVSINVFGSSITLQPLLLPAAIIMSMAVATLSCLNPIKHAVSIDPALVLKGE